MEPEAGPFAMKPFQVWPEVALARTIPIQQRGDSSSGTIQGIHIRALMEVQNGSWPMEESNLLSLSGKGPGAQVIELGARIKYYEATGKWEAVHTLGIQLGTWSQSGHIFPNGSQGRHHEFP